MASTEGVRTLGLERPNYTGIPNAILDNIDFFTSEQFKVLMMLIRQDKGWEDTLQHEDKMTVSVSFIAEKTGVSDGCVKSSLRFLLSEGIISKKSNFDKSGAKVPSTYWVNWAGPGKTPWAPNAHGGHGHQMPMGGAPNAPGYGHQMPIYKEEEKLLKETLRGKRNENLLESPLSPQDQNLPLPEESQEPEPTPLPYSGGPLPGDDIAEEATSGSDLALEDDIATFCSNGYSRQRRIRIKPKDLKGVQDKLESLEREHGQEDLRRAFLEFLGRDDEWLVKNKWPIFSFTKNPIQYMTQSPRSPRQSGGYSASPIAYRSASTSEAPANAPTASPQNTSDSFLQFVDKWNTINPDHPVGELLAATKAKLRAAASDPDFVRVHEELFEKVGKFIDAGQNLGFTWMFTGKEANWIGTMEGKYNFFLVKKSPAGGGVDMDRLIQEAEE